MNIHEYQAKELFKKSDIPIPRGRVAFSAADPSGSGVCYGSKRGALCGYYNRSVGIYQDARRAAIGLCSGYASCGSAYFGKFLGRIRPTSDDGHAEDAAARADALTGLRVVSFSSYMVCVGTHKARRVSLVSFIKKTTEGF